MRMQVSRSLSFAQPIVFSCIVNPYSAALLSMISAICPRRRDEEVERLHSRIVRAFRHNVKELAVRLCVKFVEHNAVDVESVL